MAWFSTKVRLAILVEQAPHDSQFTESVYVFRIEERDDWAALWDQAFQRALALGKQQEQEYRNDAGQRVRWRLQEIVSLDVIRSDDLDGAEIYAEPVSMRPADMVPFDTEFWPERSQPPQTGI